MKEKGVFGSLERLGHGLFDVALGLGAIALGVRFFREAFSGKKKDHKEHK